ncbi:Phosphate-selective porin O and P [Calycomorphotria hydatis]|uniref:Phosphate-selective porin O and P n=2 Tax=Calycomorphotria hydatis TaxID=2528027 RepID=A0A517T6Y3_9PLAN|nr:Phosphate-selective porin O and P [Calycomorphotria hydatis]
MLLHVRWLIPLCILCTLGTVRAEDVLQPIGQSQLDPTPIVDDQIEQAAYLSEGVEWTSKPVHMPFHVGFDHGFYLKSLERDPAFKLRVNGRLQQRYTAFLSRQAVYVDNGGNVFPRPDRNDFEMERARLEFHGNVYDPRLKFLMIIDGDTDEAATLAFLMYYFEYEFDPAIIFGMGRQKVAVSREWMNSSKDMPLVDRSMATTFFRPGFSDGIWLHGEPTEGLFYRAMLTNGLNTAGLTPGQVDNNIVPSLSVWWEPLGTYGPDYSDLEYHECPVIRVGGGLSYAVEDVVQTPDVIPNELTVVRLSDGTRLVEDGALAPGVNVNGFNVGLLSLDAAYKHQGLSLWGEYYIRTVSDIVATGPIPINRLFQHGFVVGGGYFILPKELEVAARYSVVYGDFGTGHEYAGGVNWYIYGHDLKVQFDVTQLVQNPGQSSGPGFRAGDDGVMIRAQVQVAF